MSVDHVATVCDEGRAFDERHRDELNETQRAMGGLIWGLMRALAECPNCPGTFCTPIGERFGCESAFDVLVCPGCQRTFVTAAGRAALDLRQGQLL